MATNSPRPKEFEPDPPKKASFYQVLALFTYHVLLGIFLAYAIYNVWPPQPWPGDRATTEDSAAKESKADESSAQTNTDAQNQGSAVSSVATQANAVNANSAANPPTPTENSNDTRANVNANRIPGSQPSGESSPPATAVYDNERPPPFWVLRRRFQPTLEVRLLLLVLLAGAIGSYIHASSSLVDYVGNRTMVSSWIWWYLLRPFIGMMLALLFYFVFRGGFITAGVNQGGEAAASFINPFGVAAVAGLVGMFSKVAADKLNEVFLTLFAPKQGQGDAKRADKLVANINPVLTAINPTQGPVTGATPVTLTGSNFLDAASVNFGGLAAPSVTFKEAAALIAITPPHEPGKVDVEVVNPNGLTSVLPGAFIYVDEGGLRNAADGAAGEGRQKPVTGEGGDDELIDGCDVELKADTADEELPITEGGVK